MSVESGWGSSSWGFGRWGEESDVDAAATISGQASVAVVANLVTPVAATVPGAATVAATAVVFIPGASAISASATVVVAGTRIQHPEAEFANFSNPDVVFIYFFGTNIIWRPTVKYV